MATISQAALSNAIFLNETVRIQIKISLRFVPKGQIIKYHGIGSDNGMAIN